MIDWVTATLPFTSAKRFDGGWVRSINADGAVEWQTEKRLPVVGSYDARFHIVSRGDGWMNISGNPSKFLQGHNLFGSDDLIGLVLEVMRRICNSLDMPIPIDDYRRWEIGDYDLQRVDIAYMYSLGNRANVRAWIRSAEYQSKSRHGRPLTKGGTLYWGKHSRRWAMKAYGKADEISSTKDHRLPITLGKLARSDDFGAQSRELLPRKPLDVNGNVIGNTAQQIGAQDPTILPDFLAQALRSDFNESNQGTNPMGGSQFGKLVADNPLQKANLLKLLESSNVDSAPLTDALDIFNAQGYKPPVNSATTANAAESAKLGGALSILSRPTHAIPDLIDNWRNGLSTKYLAQALSSGGSTVDDIMSLARANGTYNPMNQQLMINLMNSENNSELTEQPNQ